MFLFVELPPLNEKPTANEEEKKENDGKDESTQPKTFLNSIRVPLANMIPKRLRSGYSHDLEGGNGPNTRAGLASMETLDDSQKDVTDFAPVKGDDGMETVKLDGSDVS